MRPDNPNRLSVQHVFIIGVYGDRECFDTIRDAIEHVSNVAQLEKETLSPSVNMSALVDFGAGEQEQCSYRDRDRILSWLKRFDV